MTKISQFAERRWINNAVNWKTISFHLLPISDKKHIHNHLRGVSLNIFSKLLNITTYC